jgi:hypothetical protein
MKLPLTAIAVGIALFSLSGTAKAEVACETVNNRRLCCYVESGD